MSVQPGRWWFESSEHCVNSTLDQLLATTPHQVLHGNPKVAVRRIVTHSGRVQPGDVFVCLPGYRTEGGEQYADRHPFAAEAVQRGAVAVVLEREVPGLEPATVIRVPSTWQAAADMAARLFGNPSADLTVIGITGTSGKTSTAFFVDAILRASGWRTARLGTVDYRIGEDLEPARQTTPEAPELQALLARARDAGCRAVVMEVSSHALELRRVANVAFDVAVFTNLGRDHLNFHPDMHHYLRAKGRLFEELASGGKEGTAVVNADDPASHYIRQVNSGQCCTYAVHEAADVRAAAVETGLFGTRLQVDSRWGRFEVHVPHPGLFHAHNALAAVSVGLVLGLSPAEIQSGLGAAPAVPGRFERVDCGQNFLVVVDYAHKPEALEKLIRSAECLHPRRILTVFGCGGDRDRGKRPLMGEVAARGSDVVYVTSDNPRSERPEAIVADILEGVRRSGGRARIEVFLDRAQAIHRAIQEAEDGDVVLIAGKGHETYQIFADRTVPFDDRLVAREALRARAAVQGARGEGHPTEAERS